MSIKRILYCDSNIDGTIGGAQYSLFYLVRGLNKEKFKPIVIFYSEHTLLDTYKNAGIETHIFSRPSPINLVQHIKSNSQYFYPIRKLTEVFQSTINFCKFFLFTSVKYAFYLRKHNIDIVHLNNSVLRSNDWKLACILTRTKCISHERGINRKYDAITRTLSKRLDKIICISNAVKDNFIERNFSAHNLTVIFNGLDENEIKIDVPAQYVKEQYNIDPSFPVIGMVGNIREWKGQEVVVKATAILKESYPNIKCLLVGAVAKPDQYYMDRIIEDIRKLNIEDNIIFTGYQKNVANCVNIMDIVIHASIDPEPFGRVLIEAMAMQKPLVASRDGAVTEIVDEKITGLTFPPGDYEALAAHIKYLLSKTDISKRMGEAGYRRLKQMFHISNNVEKTESVYETIFSQLN